MEGQGYLAGFLTAFFGFLSVFLGGEADRSPSTAFSNGREIFSGGDRLEDCFSILALL